MQISQAYIAQFVARMDALNKAAGRTVLSETAKADLQRRLEEAEEYAYDEVVGIMRRTVPAYSRLAAAMTCEFYDGIREASDVKGSFAASMYDGCDEAEVTHAARAVASEVAKGTATKPLASLLADTVSRYTRKSSNETVRRNAMRDPSKPRYAVVPGPGACAFCLLIASNGYTSPKERGGNYHNHCNCQAVQVYDGQKVQGYDPEMYYGQYTEARDALASGDIPDELKERIERERAEKGDAFTKTKAELMVWRYQQNIT